MARRRGLLTTPSEIRFALDNVDDDSTDELEDIEINVPEDEEDDVEEDEVVVYDDTSEVIF